MLSTRSYSLALATTGLAIILSIVGFALYLVPKYRAVGAALSTATMEGEDGVARLPGHEAHRLRHQGAGDAVAAPLARIGWFSNNRYGPRKPNLAFRPALFALAGALDRHFDVVIVGDSFSADLETHVE